MRTKIISEREKILIQIIIFMAIIYIGICINFCAIFSNGGKMPIYETREGYITTDNEHFVFSEKSQVNYFYLTDIIYVPLFESYSSIGDFIMIIGLGLIIGLIIGDFIFYLKLLYYKEGKK